MATTKIVTSSTLSLFVSFLSLLFAASAFSPTDHYLINCGSLDTDTVDSDHRVFAGDDPRFLSSTRTIRIESADSATFSSSQLYRTARAFDRPAHYVFPIRDRGTHHLVRLHFHPLKNDYNNLYEAEFHVVANGFLLLRDYRILRSDHFPVIKEFAIPVVAEELKISFLPSGKLKFGFVNAIEVISAPQDLVADVAQLVDSEKNERIDGLLENGFETVYRVNVGGLKVTPFNDSLWRTWVTDDEYLTSSDGSQKIHFGGRIKYRTGGASREVGPDNVYNTARMIKSPNNSVLSANMTWSFKIDNGYRYVVRVHFCDIASKAIGMLYFNVYVNGNLAYENLDMSDVTNWLLASPFYADFVVGGENSGNLAVSVGPSNMSLPRGVNAILNGIEIWKLNNSMGSFDGEVCTDFLLRSWRKGHKAAILLPLVAAVFLLLSASVFMQRRRNNNNNNNNSNNINTSVGWSRLPVDVSEDNLKFGDCLSKA